MTVAAYARHRGCSRRAVHDALRAGRIARLPGGMIDAAEADRAWKVNTLEHVGGKSRATGAVATGEAEARRLLGGAGKVLSFADARRARELVKLSREALALRRMQHELVDLKDAQRRAFRIIRTWRDIEDAAVSREVPLMSARFKEHILASTFDEGVLWRDVKGFVNRMQTACADLDVEKALAQEIEDG